MESRPTSTYTTPTLLLAQLPKADTGSTQAVADEYSTYYTLVTQYLFDVCKLIDDETHRGYVPYYDSKSIYTREARMNRELFHNGFGYVLELPDDLLTVDSITFLGTALTGSQYRLVDDTDSSNGYPYKRILFNSSGLPSVTYEFTDAIVIAGEWGTHDNETSAYSTVTTTSAAVSTTTQTTVSVANGQGASFTPYQYIRIGDELMLITAVDSSGDPDILTVTRGVNGFTATTHSSGATITRWNVVNDVRLLATRMVNYWFNRRNDNDVRVQVLDTSVLIAEFSKDLTAIAQRRQRNRYGVV